LPCLELHGIGNRETRYLFNAVGSWECPENDGGYYDNTIYHYPGLVTEDDS
jgi:hypothetical protein